ncbi:MAG: DUF6642 family protein [Bacteroidota bacterium]
MKRAKEYQKNVFCLEGDWAADLSDRSSIKAALNFMSHNFGVQYIYKQCGTKDNLQYYLDRWKNKKYKSYSICYFAFHGQPGKLEVGKDLVTMEELAKMLGGACKNKIIHFGTCKVLYTEKKRIDEFLRETGALCVSGFQADVDFLESSLFDMILIDMYQQYLNMGKVEAAIKKNYRSLAHRLKFKLFHL